MPHPTDGPDANPWVLNLDGADIQALVQVRRWAARNLRRVDDNHLGDVLLVATELVTNAYDHGNGPLQVRMSEKPDPCEVLIEVDDGVPEHPVLQPAQELRTSS
jgi:anti-sigma regulatory factor (Ser/Thr protein kinase)